MPLKMGGLPDIPTPTADFVLSHLNEIQQIQELKNRVVKDLQTQCARYLEQHFSEQKFEIGTRLCIFRSKMNTYSGLK